MAARGGKKIVIVKKKVAGGGGHHGGSWKVAYADFVTAMMAFFMVMWILGMDDKTKQAIEGYFSNPVGYKKGYGAGSNPMANGSSMALSRSTLRMIVRSTEQRSFERLKESIMRKLAANDSLRKLDAQVEVLVTKDGLRIELVESEKGDVYFPLGSDRMTSTTTLVLALIGEELAALEHPVILEGHTDAAKFGVDASYTNWELSADRANAARRVLLASGLAASRIEEVRGYADTRPRVADNPMAPANRRISILLPFTSPQGVEEEAPAPAPAPAPAGSAAAVPARPPVPPGL
jgi:chemotaxis protein MotB